MPLELRPRRRTGRGFTLVELMAVVIIVGVLATLAVYAVRKYVWSAKTTEAYDMLNAIKAAEEAYRDETFSYLDVSGTLGTTYPSQAAKDGKVPWNDTEAPAALATKWRELGVSATSYVQFRYATVAGTGAPNPSGLGTDKYILPTTSSGPWYVVKAIGDQNQDDNLSIFLSSSFSPDVYVERETE
jgi:prepilin-type N-terminal cleavage/methylation domain-containing protein